MDGPDSGGVGWEAVLFEARSGEPVQRLAYRPVGWLAGAGMEELRAALDEAGTVRASWGPEPQRAGS